MSMSSDAGAIWPALMAAVVGTTRLSRFSGFAAGAPGLDGSGLLRFAAGQAVGRRNVRRALALRVVHGVAELVGERDRVFVWFGVEVAESFGQSA